MWTLRRNTDRKPSQNNTRLSNSHLSCSAKGKDKKAAADNLGKARDEFAQAQQDYYKADLGRLNAVGAKALNDLFKGSKDAVNAEIASNTARIEALNNERNEKMKSNAGSVSQIAADELDLESPRPPTPPPGATPPPPDETADYFTSISLSVEASFQHEESTQKSDTTSASVSGRIMGVSFGGGFSHSKSSADCEKQMANSSMKISFECMRVDIGRDWMRPELFFDDDLQVAKNAKCVVAQ